MDAPDCLAALFDSLYERHRGAVFSWFLGQSGDRERAKDLLQETFVRVWQHRSEAAAIPSERAMYWVFSIARNVAIDASRRSKVRSHLWAPMPSRVPMTTDPSQEVFNRSTLNRLNKAIGELPTDLREVLTMSVVGGITSDEIGCLLNRPAGTVRYQLSEARRRLASKVEL